jgi:hypothetical protein
MVQRKLVRSTKEFPRKEEATEAASLIRKTPHLHNTSPRLILGADRQLLRPSGRPASELRTTDDEESTG